MDRFLRLILVFTAFFTFSAFDVTVDEILGAIKKGDAMKISRHFDNLVEITLNDRSSSYSRTQAEVVLKDFFSNHNVRSFTVIHRVNSNNGEYCVGTLNTSGGEYRTTILFKTKGDKKLVQELRFE
ncbi:MAG TPA: DUF4783 domain-containing protein [Chitinophagaceae bacterium]|nr:DUF4783 domain-containing protein [Chitinophagaceae bacterium]